MQLLSPEFHDLLMGIVMDISLAIKPNLVCSDINLLIRYGPNRLELMSNRPNRLELIVNCTRNNKIITC